MKRRTYLLTGLIGGLLGILPFALSTGDMVECVVGFIFGIPIAIISFDFIRGYRKAKSMYHLVVAYFV